jgi:hypothetical protein
MWAVIWLLASVMAALVWYLFSPFIGFRDDDDNHEHHND